MPIDATAERLARFLSEQKYVEVYGHRDADGVTAASLVCHALWRRGIGFRLRIVDGTPGPAGLGAENPALLCDLGAGLTDLPENVAVIDHHAPVADVEGVVMNPHAAGYDGERVLSAAALAFGVAGRLADCRDLAGLAAAGVTGDGQAFEAENAEILNEGIANGVLEIERGIALPGGSIVEQLELATDPFLPGISGNAERVRELLRASMTDGGPAIDLLLSLAVLEAAGEAAPGALERIWGDRVLCPREAVGDVRSLAAVVDACAKDGRGGLAASVCLRSPVATREAVEVASSHRRCVIEAIAAAIPLEEAAVAVRIQDSRLAGDVATALAGPLGRPVMVAAPSGDGFRLSVRGDGSVPLGPLLRQLAAEAGGSGGGHARKAGAIVPCEAFPAIAAAFAEAIGA